MPYEYRPSEVDGPLSTVPQRVLVIGGGPSGLIALRNMIERGGFALVELYERRDDVGGVWSVTLFFCKRYAPTRVP